MEVLHLLCHSAFIGGAIYCDWFYVQIVLLSLLKFPMIFGTYYYTEEFGIPYDWDAMPRWYVISAQVILALLCQDSSSVTDAI